MTLEVRHLVKHFGGVQAVRGVSFGVAAGECVALIGPMAPASPPPLPVSPVNTR